MEKKLYGEGVYKEELYREGLYRGTTLYKKKTT